MLEGKNIEFKRQYTDDIKYAVLAFANTEEEHYILVLMMMVAWKG